MIPLVLRQRRVGFDEFFKTATGVVSEIDFDVVVGVDDQSPRSGPGGVILRDEVLKHAHCGWVNPCADTEGSVGCPALAWEVGRDIRVGSVEIVVGEYGRRRTLLEVERVGIGPLVCQGVGSDRVNCECAVFEIV